MSQREILRRFSRFFWAVVVSAFVLIIFPLLLDVVYRKQVEIIFDWRLIVSGVIATTASLLCYHYLMVKEQLKHVADLFRDRDTIKKLAAGLGIAILITVIVVGLQHLDGERSLLERILDNPGGIFAIVTGVASIAGIYAMLGSVTDLKATIRSFSEYIERITKLINETENGDTIRMLVHTPATGCLALKDEIWHPLSNLLKTSSKRYRLICLSQEQMNEWFLCYIKANDSDSERVRAISRRIERGIEMSRLIKDNIRFHSDGDSGCGVVEALWDQLPCHYMICNRSKAIVAIPFFLPTKTRPVPEPYDEGARVEIIGFETSEHRIVESVRSEIDFWAKSVAPKG